MHAAPTWTSHGLANQRMRMFSHTTCLLMACISFYSAASQASNPLLDMADRLDALDRQDLQTALSQANSCTRARNFSCSEAQIKAASKLTSTPEDRRLIASAQQMLGVERERVEEERRQEERRLEAERQATLRAERERERRLAEEERRYREESSGDSGNAMALGILQGLAQVQRDSAQISSIHNNMVRQMNQRVLEQQQREAHQRQQQQAQALRAERQREDTLRAQRHAQQSLLLAQQERQQYAQEAESRRRTQQLADEQHRREQVAAQEAARQQQAAANQARELKAEQARQDRIAKQEAEKAAKSKAESDYLAEVKRQFRLVARTCPDGEGKYYAVGINPKITPKVVACYGIKFRAQCMGGGISAYGGTSHFASMSTSCFAGEAVPMEPKLNCKPENVQITVTEVTPC